MLQKITDRIPEFCLSHWLLRIPVSIVFIQQGLSKLPFSIEDAEAFGLPSLVWWFVILGELGAGIGLLVGGVIGLQKYWNELGDLLSRFCGITICSIMTGVIWVGQPESFWDVLLYDNLHVLLWVGGLFFALRGNRS
ncbi:MAG: hypothetical protein CBE00_08440 [Planctomycetaceae bacterium TMED240]|nr:MAG: hypothetical protein CBE00_08440 [Planctomycetaceae bacterium TMED240]